MVIVLSIIGAILPAWFLLRYFLKLDNRRPEPANSIRKAVILGFVAVIPAMVIEQLLASSIPAVSQAEKALIEGFLVAGLVEEGIKFAFVAIWLFKMREFDEVADGIVYTVCVSLGFALVENILYSLDSPLTMLARAFTAVPMHAAMSGIMGYFIGRAKLGRRHWQYIGLACAVALHGIYDFFALLGGWWGFMVIPIVILSSIGVYRLFQAALRLDDAAAAKAQVGTGGA